MDGGWCAICISYGRFAKRYTHFSVFPHWNLTSFESIAHIAHCTFIFETLTRPDGALGSDGNIEHFMNF